ncbi:MAG TPA: helix-turn-helix domain-containing protein [Intrasporangium sp.]|nr:helix-turn-helix domain-containing protein [Intrasporangium sp.]
MGIPMRLVAALAVGQDGQAHVHPDRLDTVVHRTTSLGAWLGHAAAPTHDLLLAEADVLRPQLDADPDVVHRLAGAGAGGLVVAGADEVLAERVRAAAAAAALPLLLLPPGRLDRFNTDVLEAVLEHQTAILQRVEDADHALVQIVLAGGSLEDLCHQLVGFLGGAAMVTTSDGRVLARAGSQAELAAAESLDCFDRTGRLLTESEPVGIRPQHGPAAHRAVVRILAGSLDHGVLFASCSTRPLTRDDVRLLERAATVAALAITKEQAVSAVESKYRAEFLRDALVGRAGHADEAIAHASSLGWDIRRPLAVVVAVTDEDDERTTRSADEVRFLQQRFARAWTHAVAMRDPHAPVMGFSREVVALLGVPADADTERVMRPVTDLVRVVRGDGGGGRRSFSTGVSRPVTSVAELPRAYEEARGAVSVGRQLHGDGALTHVDGLGIYRLLALVPDKAQLRRFVEDALGDLATDGSPENADLRQTLRILLDTNLNVAETARLLFFHYNTLRYRITKLEKLLGPFTDDPELRLTLALALKVHAMRGI